MIWPSMIKTAPARVSPTPIPIIPPSITIKLTTLLRRNLWAPTEDLGLAVMLRVKTWLMWGSPNKRYSNIWLCCGSGGGRSAIGVGFVVASLAGGSSSGRSTATPTSGASTQSRLGWYVWSTKYSNISTCLVSVLCMCGDGWIFECWYCKTNKINQFSPPITDPLCGKSLPHYPLSSPPQMPTPRTTLGLPTTESKTECTAGSLERPSCPP